MARDVRIWLVGVGTVGRWLLGALHEQAPRLERRYGLLPKVVGAATTRGFVHDPRGLDVHALVELASRRRPFAELGGVDEWPSAIQGLEATEADVLVEVTASPPHAGEPGATHMLHALRRSVPVVTSNKWPVALHGVELSRTAREHGVPFRAESTVMSGTPVLSSLVEGIAGATPVALRGIVNATANFVLTRMEEGASYDGALAQAQELGLAEPDASADVEGFDAMAKAMVLAALVFDEQLRPDDVLRRGIAGIDRQQVETARAAGNRLKEVVVLQYAEGGGRKRLAARVEPVELPATDPLASVGGITNAVVLRAKPLSEITITGPGAGPERAGQGVLSDLIAVSRWRTGR